MGNAGGGSSQLAHMGCAVDNCIHEGKEAMISPLVYHSHKSTRSGSSTLLVESNSMSESLADCEWVASWIGLVKDLHYDLRKRDLLNREFKLTSIMSETDSDLELATITDAKSLYDNTHTTTPKTSDKRLTIDLAIIRTAIEQGHIQDLIWRSEAIQASDCLTKPMTTELIRRMCINGECPTRPLKETKRQAEKRRGLEKKLFADQVD